jgi:hypothetical protein
MPDLYARPWKAGGTDFPRSLLYPRGMIGPEERRAYYWLGRNWLSDEGCIVDAGAFLGASTYCFAAGAAAGGRRQFRGGPIVHAYDFFKVVDAYVGEAIRKDFCPIKQGESYLDIFEYQTARWADVIRTYPGDFLTHRWKGDPIEILFIDIAKTQPLNSHAIAEFFPSLMPGRSVVVHQDYFHCWHPYIHVAMEYFSDEFEMVDEHVPHQSRIWRLSKAIAREKIERIRDYTLDKAERLALLDRLVEKSTPHSRPMMEVVRLWQHCLDKDYESARQGIARMRSIYDVDGSAELWFRQAIQVEQHMQKVQR